MVARAHFKIYYFRIQHPFFLEQAMSKQFKALYENLFSKQFQPVDVL